MLRDGVPIGKIFGVEIRLHISWFVIFAIVTWLLATSVLPSLYQNWSTGLYVVVGLITSLLFFASVLVHELMHSLVAMQNKIPVKSITLFIFGGVSQISQEPAEPGVEFRVAIAGPATSIVLGIAFLAVYYLTSANASVPVPVQAVRATCSYLSYINILLGVFNLIPAFPMDGGRVFRSIVWGRTHDLRRSTQVASNVGRTFALIFIIGGVFIIFYAYPANLFNGLWIGFIGWFLWSAATSSYQQLLLQQALQGHAAREIMTTDCPRVSPDITVERLVEDEVLHTARRCFLVDDDKTAQGLVTLSEISTVPPPERRTKQAGQIMKSIDKLHHVAPDTDLATVMRLLTDQDVNQLPVVDNGRVVGMIARENLLNFINLRIGSAPT